MSRNYYKPPLEVFQEARRTIFNGWHQGRYSDEEERSFCTLGAISQATYWGEAQSIFTCVGVFRVANPQVNNIVDWNDTKGRTKKEVLAAFDKTVTLLQSPEAEAIIERVGHDSSCR